MLPRASTSQSMGTSDIAKGSGNIQPSLSRHQGNPRILSISIRASGVGGPVDPLSADLAKLIKRPRTAHRASTSRADPPNEPPCPAERASTQRTAAGKDWGCLIIHAFVSRVIVYETRDLVWRQSLLAQLLSRLALLEEWVKREHGAFPPVGAGLTPS